MIVGVTMGLIALLGVTSIYYWVARRESQQRKAEAESQ